VFLNAGAKIETGWGRIVAEQQSYEFVEVKAADIMAERQALWSGFTRFFTVSTGAIIVALVLLYLLWG
jgi:hypothetical protein